ncbi:hypothetical protein [Quadrisphaera granulorum]|uniref:hypothetical protein n=1 Tax=Quadrisphaera granulorum TaxID=317664 RepID=UPI0011B4BE31|nr:hypothetical protein [Quadrisphaera granulorum]
MPSAAKAASTSAAPQAAAAAAPVWAVACTGSGKRDKIVRSGYTRKSVTARNNNMYLRGGTTNLTCGFQDNDRDTGMGYLHIAHDHGQDWSNLAALTGENWRDVADAGMVASLGYTDYAGSDPRRDAMCFSGEISLINKRTGQTVKRQAVRTIVQYQSPNNVITANPGKC